MDSREQQIIDSWQERARAYQELTERWSIFGRLAERLIDLLPSPLEGPVIDLAAGAGLLSARLLQRHPQAQVYLVEPAEAMLELAVRRIGNRSIGHAQVSATQMDRVPIRAGAVLCSAAVHLVDETAVFPSVARVLKPGGLFIFNLWWHSWESTAHIDPGPRWRALLEQAMAELGETATLPAPTRPRIRTRHGFSQAGQRAGLDTIHTQTDTDRLPLGFFLDFTAMASDFLAYVSPSRRAMVLRAARARANAEVRIQTTRFVLQKRAARP